MVKPANERNQLRKWIAALDNGADLQFVPMDPGGTAGDMPLDAAEVFASRGIAPGEGTWFGWDRVGDSNAFAAGQLVGPLCLWADGDLDRIADLLVEVLPDEYEIAVGDDLLQISRGLTADELALPDLVDEQAVIARIGIISESRPGADGYREDETARIEAERREWAQTEPVQWLQLVMAAGTPRAQRAALSTQPPRTAAAVTGLLTALPELTKDWMALETLIRGMQAMADPRLDQTVDQLAAMRGWAPRSAAAAAMAETRSDEASEALVWKWMVGKRRYSHSEPVPGATRALIQIRARRTGREPLEVARELRADASLSDDVHATIEREIETLAR